jgi:hypothetical protein
MGKKNILPSPWALSAAGASLILGFAPALGGLA